MDYLMRGESGRERWYFVSGQVWGIEEKRGDPHSGSERETHTWER